MQNMTGTPDNETLAPAPLPEQTSPALHSDAHLEGAALEHLSVLGFLRRVPHDQPLGMQNMMKFGNLAGNMARAFHVPYQATVEPEFGVVQAFPEPMLMRAYRYISPALGWPRVLDLDGLRPRQDAPVEGPVMTPVAELHVRKTMVLHLRSWAAHALESDIRSACRIILAVLEQECAALERQIARDEQHARRY